VTHCALYWCSFVSVVLFLVITIVRHLLPHPAHNSDICCTFQQQPITAFCAVRMDWQYVLQCSAILLKSGSGWQGLFALLSGEWSTAGTDRKLIRNYCAAYSATV
jgi:hypothetical protein